MSNVLEELEWIKGNYTRVTAQYTRIELSEQEIEAFGKIEKCLNRLETLEHYLVKWEKQLQVDGVNSKSMVLNDIKFLLKEEIL